MSKVLYQSGAACAALVLTALLSTAQSAHAQAWGTIKGQVVLKNGLAIPKNEQAKVEKDKTHCLAKGPILKNELVVNSKNRGVKWALVWLTGVNDPKGAKPIPIHPSLAKMAPTVSVDQPQCGFEPRVMGMRDGQTLTVNNSSPIAHNSDIKGGLVGPNVNPLIPPKGQFTTPAIKARYLPIIMYTCSIHPWMKGYVGVFRHPYFAVTDADGNFEIKNAPAGKYRLMAWQEQAGWVIINPKNLKDKGKVIDIKAGGTTDVGKIPFTPSKD